jgi:hypothetical protein
VELCDGSGAIVSGQLVLFPMVVNKASIQFFVYLGCKVLL